MFALRLVSLALFVALASYALHFAVQDSKYRYVLSTAARLELGKPVSAKENALAADIVFKPSFQVQCRSEILRPALSVVLFNLDRTNQTIDYQAWASAHNATEKFLVGMMRCMPSDGNVWMREALVSRAIAADPERLRQKIAVSRKLMPYESMQVLARLVLWKRVSPFALNASGEFARADIRAALLYGNKTLKAWLDKDMSEAFAALLKSERDKINRVSS